jgi:hypothetical protein
VAPPITPAAQSHARRSNRSRAGLRRLRYAPWALRAPSATAAWHGASAGDDAARASAGGSSSARYAGGAPVAAPKGPGLVESDESSDADELSTLVASCATESDPHRCSERMSFSACDEADDAGGVPLCCSCGAASLPEGGEAPLGKAAADSRRQSPCVPDGGGAANGHAAAARSHARASLLSASEGDGAA